MKKLWSLIVANYPLVALTFQLFWIAVFLLERLGQGAGGGVPQFVYVNF